MLCNYWITELTLILHSIMSFKAHIMEKLRQLVGVHYQLDSNRTDKLKALQEKWAFFDLKSHAVYNLTVI